MDDTETETAPVKFKYEILSDSFIDALEQLMGQHLRNDDGKISSYEMMGDAWSMKLKIKTPKAAPKKKS